MSPRLVFRRVLSTLGLLLLGGCCSPLSEELNRPLPRPGQIAIDDACGHIQRPPSAAPVPALGQPREAPAEVVQATLQAPVNPGGETGPAPILLPQPQKEGGKKPLSQIEKLLIVPQVIPGAEA